MLKIERFVCNPFQENCYVVSDESREAIIVDCGAFYEAERRALTDYINRGGLKPVHLVATHAHIDHNFGNDTVFSEYGLKPEVHCADQPLMEKLPSQAREYCGITLAEPVPPVGKYLSDDDTIAFGSHVFTIVSTPGHTPGSVLFYCEAEKLAFSGDTIFRMAIGRTDLELGSPAAMRQSLAKIARELPGDTTLLPGHGGQTTVGEEVF